MKLIILVACALVAVAVAAPLEKEPAQLVRSDFQQQPDGAYNWDFESSDGVKRQETGELKEAFDEENKPHTVVVVRGSFSYISPNGDPVEVTYKADENGYEAQGETIPKAPVASR